MEQINIIDTKAWSSIDIFLFSNGQQYSPPRKYHLTSEELQWWEATLSYLGHTQYGSGQSTIEIYTIDGTKINGPLQLINGAAYVAVKPPDSFINSGYEDYLLKATRSWEKRLAQKAIDNETPKSENKNLKIEVGSEEINTEENFIDEAVLPKASEEKEIPSGANIHLNKTKRGPQRKSVIKQIQKKKSSDAHNAILKRICAETDKIVPRKSSLKKGDNTNVKRLSITCSTREEKKRNISQPQAMRSKRANFEKQLKSGDNKNNSIQQVTEAYRTKEFPNLLHPFEEEVNLKNETGTDQNVNKTLSSEEQHVISIYKNKDIDLASLQTDPDYDRMFDDELKNNFSTQKRYIEPEDVITRDNEKEIHGNKIHDYGQNISLRKSFNNEEEKTKRSDTSIKLTETNSKKLNNEYITFNNQAKVSENQVSDEYIAYMNKGNLLLLKFHIKVKDCKTICNRYKGDCDLTTSFINMLKTEKTSQVNIDINFSGELLNPNKEVCTENKSLQSQFHKFCTENVNSKEQSKNPRFIIVQCACQNLKEESLCRCFEKQEKSKTVNRNKFFTGCQCDDRPENVSRDENLRNTVINLSPEEKDKSPSSSNLSQINGTRVRTLAQKFEGSDKIGSNDTNHSNVISYNNNVSNIENSLKSIVLTQLIQTNKDPEVTSQNNNISLKYRYDKATQTDWSNVIFEARCHEDNTYTFHFPSLYVLKLCKL